LPEVKGLDSCPIALATVAAIKTFQRASQDSGQKKKKEQEMTIIRLAGHQPA
jgi:hypothetical protein